MRPRSALLLRKKELNINILPTSLDLGGEIPFDRRLDVFVRADLGATALEQTASSFIESFLEQLVSAGLSYLAHEKQSKSMTRPRHTVFILEVKDRNERPVART